MQKASEIKDRYGFPLTTSSPTAAEHFIEGVDLFLAQNFGPEESFKQATEADEGFAVAHAGLALMSMFRIAPAEARESAERARSFAVSASRRERQQIEAIELFINGEGPKALALIREHLAEFPRDILMLRLGARLLLLGCSGAGVASYPQELLGICRSLAPEYGDDWAFLGQHSFAHHENGLLDEALQLAERSLELRPTNANASHSVAHVFFERGDPSGGGDFLGHWLVGFDNRAPFHVHLSWHQALFQLAMGHYDQALSLYEGDIRPSVVAESPISLADSASLMWRLQIYGGSTSPLAWDEVRKQAAPAAEKTGPAFRDSHAALAFAAAGDEGDLGRMIDGLRSVADGGNALAREVTLPLVQGISAFAHEDYDEAVRLIEPVFPELTRLGGSHAQREVFEDTLLEAYLRAGQFDKAEDLLRTRLSRRTTPRDMYWLGRAQAGNEQRDQASTSFSEASQGWWDADPASPEIAALQQLAERAD